MPDDVDLVYDRSVADEKLKVGAKYERLAALVFHILTKQTTVHDMRLRGGVGVRHQIDVVVGHDSRRILVETKKYDRKVDLGVVRAFSAVVDDLNPSEAFVITTVGFSKRAQTWAKAKGLRLAILRPPGGEDWEGLVRNIHLTLKVSVPGTPSIQFLVHPDEGPRFEGNRNPIGGRPTEELWFETPGGTRTSFNAVFDPLVEEQYVAIPPGKSGEMGGSFNFEGPTKLVVPGEQPISISGFEWSQPVASATRDFTIGDGVGGLAAELVLRTLDGGIHRMFTNKQIADLSFDEVGKVIGDTLGLSMQNQDSDSSV